MFSQASVCSQVGPPLVIRPQHLSWWSSLETCSNLFTRGSYPTAPVLTSSGGHTYGWQVGGTHPTGMLSCVILCSKSR